LVGSTTDAEPPPGGRSFLLGGWRVGVRSARSMRAGGSKEGEVQYQDAFKKVEESE
jgi:hypothetical protein